MGQLWPFLDLLVVAVGFYGSESVPKMVSLRSETFWGPVFGRVCPEVRSILQILQDLDCFSFSSVGFCGAEPSEQPAASTRGESRGLKDGSDRGGPEHCSVFRKQCSAFRLFRLHSDLNTV